MTRKVITILIIVSLFAPTFVWAETSTVTSFTSCAAAGFISNLVRDGLNKLRNWITGQLGNWIGIPISGGSKVPVIDESVKKEVESFKKSYGAKEGAEDVIARCTAREILTAMGRNINNIARTGGRDGGPAWVRNWRNFQLEAQYRGEGVFRGMLFSTNLCNYFGKDLKELFNAKKKADLTKIQTRTNDFDSFQFRAGCTMPNNFNFNKYKQDFSGNGGWEAWSRLLEPQNNFYGAFFRSLDEADRQRAIEESADINEAGRTGFTSIRGRNAADSCAVKNPTDERRCLVYKDILTPGGIVSGAVVGGIESELQWVAATDELNEVIASAINVLTSRLWDLSNSNEGDYIIPESPGIIITPFPTPMPTPTPTIPPEEEPTPTPEPTPPSDNEPASLLSDVRVERAKYPASFTALCPNVGDLQPPTCPIGEMLNAVAWKNKDAGWVLLGKAIGSRCPMSNGTPISCDFLVHRPTLFGYDVLIGSEDQATPQWDGPNDMSGSIANGSRTLVAPTQP